VMVRSYMSNDSSTNGFERKVAAACTA
jgi:hypothetical protein